MEQLFVALLMIGVLLSSRKTQGLIILEVKQDDRAAQAGLREKDIILAVDLKAVGTVKELAKILILRVKNAVHSVANR